MKARKEITVAVIIGLFLAILITGGILRARTAIKSIQKNNPSLSLTNKTGSRQNDNTPSFFLDIETQDNKVVSTDKFMLSGKTIPKAYIAITGEKGEYLIVPNELGTFSQEVVLIKGANTLKVTVYQDNGEKIEKTINVVYTTAEI